MGTLKNALAGMANIPQFFAWRLTWDAAEGKYSKVPCFPDGSIFPMPAQDPANWLSYDAAMSVVTRLRDADPLHQYTLGFYFTANCGYWFLDVDKCIDGTGAWSPVASWLYHSLSGCAFEYSSSLTGVHFFGRGALPPDRQIKPSGSGMELYHEGRGVAFGLSGEATGCADTPESIASLMWHTVVPAYFPPVPRNGIDVDGVGPVAEWRGPADDADLLRRALNSSSLGAKFGTRATFADLWNNDRAALAVAYPDGGDVAESEADMALAMHLAFWTGKDADRMERLMRQSSLYRPKWDDHATYLRKLTINNARAMVSKVLQDKPVEVRGVEVLQDAPVRAVGVAIEGSTYADAEAQQELFKGCIYIADENKVFVPHDMGFQLLGAEQFSTWFGNYSYVKDREGKAMAKNAFDAFARSTMIKWPMANRAGFRPDLEPGCIFLHEGFTYVNTYIPFQPRRVVGDPGPFLRHVAMMLPVERDQQLLLAYLAACVQHKGIKFQWAPVVQGMPGNGKSLLGDAVTYALGGNFVHLPSAKELGEKFNDWLYEKLFIQVDEMRVKRGEPEVMDILKPMITAKSQQIEAKGGKKRMRNVCANFYMSMNEKRNFVREDDDRRFAFFYTAQQVTGDMERTGMTPAYMREFLRWWDADGKAIVAEWLHTYAIPSVMNPAYNMRCPETSSSGEVVEISRDSAEEQIIEAIAQGGHGFKNGWLCWQRAKALFNYTIPPSVLERYLSRLGYVPHPGLKGKGWTNNPLFSEGNTQVRLYVKADHPSISQQLTTAEIAKLYESQQSLFAAPPPPQHLKLV